MLSAFKAGAIWDEELKKWMSSEELLQHPNPKTRATWHKSSENEFGNLFQGFEDTKGMNVCTFVRKHMIPRNKKITYPRTVVAYQPEKWTTPIGQE